MIGASTCHSTGTIEPCVSLRYDSIRRCALEEGILLRHREERYGPITRGLHWTVALLMVGLLSLGWYLADLSYFHRWYNTSVDWHKALGMLALVAGVVNVGWAMGRHRPAPIANRAVWERLTVRCVHLALFAMMVAIPVTGYLVSTSAGDGISIFGWFEVPALLPVSDEWRELAVALHYYLAYVTAALVLLHAAAAFKHQFVDRDGTLARML
jgi:cytochrome b561